MYVQLISNQSGSACPAGNCAVHRVPVLPVLHAALAHGTGCRGCAAERTLGRREKVGQGRPTRTGGLCHVSRNKKKEESRLSSSGEHGRATQSCTGAFLRLPVTAAKQQRSLARAPFCACQAKQQRSRTQSCMGSLFCLPGETATHLASTTVIQHDGHPARRSSSTTARYRANPGCLGGTPCWGIVHWDSNPSVSVFVWVSVFGYRLMYRLM